MIFNTVTTAFLEHISGLSITDIIEGIIAGKYTKEALKYASDKIRQKHFEGKYYFTPNPDELELIKTIEKSDLYLRTRQLIGIHPLFSLLRLGMYVDSLNEKGRKSKVNEVRTKVYKKYGDKGIRVLNLASTGELSYVLENMGDYYQRIKCDQIKLCTLFDYILSKWNLITIFVKKELTEKQIEKLITSMIKKEYPYFFVFSYGSASNNTYKTIARMEFLTNTFRKNKYLPQLRRYRKEQEDYGWVVEHLEKDISDFV